MRERIFAALQYACLGTGALLVSMVALARLDGEVGRQSAIASFEATVRAPDQSLWSPERVKDYEASLSIVKDEPLAILRIPDLGLEVPVYATSSELHLNRGAGLIEGMGLPDKGGNLGIAGHRDGFFRVLKDITPGERDRDRDEEPPAHLPRRLDRGRGCHGPPAARRHGGPDHHARDLLPVLFPGPRTPAVHRARHVRVDVDESRQLSRRFS